VALSPEQRWAFARAFGVDVMPLDSSVPGTLDGDEAARVTLALDLAARVAARVPLQHLAGELGRAPALRLFEAHARQAERARRLHALAPELAGVAAQTATPIAFLKAAALYLTGVARPESRPAGDVDVLVPEARADVVARALERRGFRRADVPAGTHQLAPLVDGAGRVVEIHFFVPGPRAPGTGAKATFEALRSAPALERVTRLPGEAYVPARELLAAHALAHGLVQSGRTPHVYSLTRLLADALDLGLHGDGGLVERAAAWLEGHVARGEIDAVVALARRLAAGDAALFDEAQAGAPAPEAVLLRHVVAGALDDGYRRVLRAQAALAGEDRGAWARVRAAWRALALTDAQVDALYGRPRGRTGYAWRRALRPFDLAWRFVRARATARRVNSA
jgi:hypothetical protein